MGIQAIKGVEVGDGFATAARRGSEAHDELYREDGEIVRTSDRAGGTEGGMSTGTVLRVRAGMKPIATVPHALHTSIVVATGEDAAAHHQRSDVCAVPASGVVAEAMVALVLRPTVLEKFGGDSLTETNPSATSTHARGTAGDPAFPPDRRRSVPGGRVARGRVHVGPVTGADASTTGALPGTDVPVVVIGPMGAGKSSVGKRVAKALGVPFTDTDGSSHEHTDRSRASSPTVVNRRSASSRPRRSARPSRPAASSRSAEAP